MGIVVDLIIAILIALCAFIGYKRGLSGSLIKLLSFAIAVVVALVLYKPLAKFAMEKTPIGENIHAAIVQTLNQTEPSEETKEKTGGTNFVQNLEDSIQKQAESAKKEIVEQTAAQATETVVNAGSLILLFVATRLVLVIVSIFVKQVTKLPVVKQIDEIGGIAYGLVEGLIVIYVVFAIISLASAMFTDNAVVTAISQSYIGKMLYNNNIILKYFM